MGRNIRVPRQGNNSIWKRRVPPPLNALESSDSSLNRMKFSRILPVLVLALGPVLLLAETLVGGRVLSQADSLLAYSPWDEVAPAGYRPGNPLLEDQSTLMVPWHGWAAGQVAQGELPLWNPLNYGGQPIHAANSGAFLFPLNLLHLLFPTQHLYAWTALARLLAAGLFAFLYLRRLGLGPWTALPGAAAFSLSGFMIAWLGHPHANIALFLPLGFWLVERAADRPGGRTAALAGLISGLVLLGGHVQTALHVFLAVGAYALFRSCAACGGKNEGRSESRMTRAGWKCLAIGGALGGLLAAPQLLPLAEYLAHSQGILVLEELEQTDPVTIGEAAILMVDPGHHGAPHLPGGYRGPSGRNLNYSELIGGYVGRLVLLLAAAGLILKRHDARVRFLAGLAIVSALIAWHVWPLHDLFRGIPRLRSTNPMRLLLFTAFGLSALGSIGAAELARRFRLGEARTRIFGCALTAVVMAELLSFGTDYNPATPPDLVYPRTPITDFLADQDPLQRAQGLDGTTLRASANLPYDIPVLSGYDKIEYRPMTELTLLLTSDPPAAAFASELSAFDRFEALPLASLLGLRWLVVPPGQEAGANPPAPLTVAYTSPGGAVVLENPLALPRAFVSNGFEIVPDPAERLRRMGAADFNPRVALLESAPTAGPGTQARRATIRAEPPPGSVRVVSYAPRDVHLEAAMERPGLVVLTDAWNPGWSVWVDGEATPIERVDHALRGVWLGEGSHDLHFHYGPSSVLLGALLGLLGAAGIALAWRKSGPGFPV